MEHPHSSAAVLEEQARLTLHEVLTLTKMSKSKLYLLLLDDQFPKPIKRGRTVRWTKAQVADFLRKEANK